MLRWAVCPLLSIVLLTGCGDQASGELDRSDVSDSGAENPTPASTPTSSTAVEQQPDGSFRFTPTSDAAETGRPYEYTAYTHCGLDYAFDFDGSFWEVVDRPREERTRLQDPEDHGVVELVQDDAAIFTSQRGDEYRLARREGPKEVAGLCS